MTCGMPAMLHLCRLSVAALIAAASVVILPAKAQTKTDLQLVLAVDASGSVNTTRFELQKRGYAEAFRSPRVLSANTRRLPRIFRRSS